MSDLEKATVVTVVIPAPDSDKPSHTTSREPQEIIETSEGLNQGENQLSHSESPPHPLFFWRGKQKERNSEIATQRCVFDNPNLAQYYRPDAKYENAHCFDPSLRWTWGEELRLVSGLDLRIVVWACAAMFVWDLNRNNLQQAMTDNVLQDLGLNTDDYNLGNTISRVTALCVEVPAVLMSRRVGL